MHSACFIHLICIIKLFGTTEIIGQEISRENHRADSFAARWLSAMTRRIVRLLFPLPSRSDEYHPQHCPLIQIPWNIRQSRP